MEKSLGTSNLLEKARKKKKRKSGKEVERVKRNRKTKTFVINSRGSNKGYTKFCQALLCALSPFPTYHHTSKTK